jgi:hypothetical protein
MSETLADKSPWTTTQMTERLTGAAGRLADLLHDEVQLLQTMRAGDIEARLPDKRAAVKDYRDLLDQLAERPGLLGDLDPQARAGLEATAERLADAAQANARALQAGIDANARLVKAIALAVRDEQLGGGRYLANGSPTDGAPANQPVAVSVNQVL